MLLCVISRVKVQLKPTVSYLICHPVLIAVLYTFIITYLGRLTEINMMWAGHQVHHSSTEYNYSTALRQSVLQPYYAWVKTVNKGVNVE